MNLFYSHTQGVFIGETIQRMREGIEAHKAQLPQASEAAKALAAEQRARLSELKVLLDAAAAAGDGGTYKKLEAEMSKLAACPADEAHLFFWLGAPLLLPIDWPPLARTPDAPCVCHGRLHHAKAMQA